MSLPDYLSLLGGTIGVAGAIALALGYVARRWAPRFGLVDAPDGRKSHAQPTPLGGGLAIYLGVLLPLAAGHALLLFAGAGKSGGPVPEWIPELARPHLAGLYQQLESMWIFLVAGGVLVITGLADDRYRLGWQIRLAVQFAVAAFCVFACDWRFTVFLNWPGVTGWLSVLWIVALVNAFNMLDNMDGLSAGVGAICAGTLALVLLSPGLDRTGPQLFVAGMLLLLTGSLLGFLWHNRPPARLFMGDAGSYFIGFVLAVMSTLADYTHYESTQRHVILAPLCALAVPLYDLASVVAIRIKSGRSPFQADHSHFSHRLVELGMTRTQAVLTIYLTTGICCLGALLLPRVDAVGACLIVLLEACVLLLVAVLEIVSRRKLSR